MKYVTMASALTPRARGEEAYSDLQRHPGNSPVPGLIIFRFNTPIYFANAQLFHRRIKEQVKAGGQEIKAVIVDMVANDRLDVTSIEMLEKLAEELQRNRIEMLAVHVHQPVLDIIQRSGLAEHFKTVSTFGTIDSAVHDYLNRHKELPDG